MRNISFMLTPDQIMAETKFVTRRNGWWFVKPEELLQGVRKCQGLKKGEKIERLKVIRVFSTHGEPLEAITPYEVELEGFPEMTVGQFIDMFMKSHKGVNPESIINRIQFTYPKDTERLI